MPRLLDTNSRTDELAHALAQLIGEDGLEAPSSRRVAARVGLSIGTLAHHYESRTRLLRVLSFRIGLALLDEITPEIRTIGAAAMLRTDDEGRLLTRAWLGAVELGRSSEDVGYSVADIIQRERSCLIGASDHLVRDPVTLEALHALVHGLRAATCRKVDPLDVETAREILGSGMREAQRTASAAALPAASRRAVTIASGSSAE